MPASAPDPRRNSRPVPSSGTGLDTSVKVTTSFGFTHCGSGRISENFVIGTSTTTFSVVEAMTVGRPARTNTYSTGTQYSAGDCSVATFHFTLPVWASISTNAGASVPSRKISSPATGAGWSPSNVGWYTHVWPACTFMVGGAISFAFGISTCLISATCVAFVGSTSFSRFTNISRASSATSAMKADSAITPAVRFRMMGVRG